MTDKKYNFYLAVKDSYDHRVVPALWCSAKTYYEENSTKSGQWTWADPWIAYNLSIDKILDICRENPPNVFGCSVFVWNELFMVELGRRVKEQHPDCLIVYGGPQIDIKYSNDYFKNHPWVDVVCPSDGYGEIIIKELLDHYPIQDFEDIPYIYYTNEKREKLFSKKTIEKRSFKWPSNIYKAQEETLKTIDLQSSFFESSRGCPYKCIYCDWGGGTYTKISKKPYTIILDELEWLAKNKSKEIDIVDANFGIMDIDISIAEHIVELHKKYGYPKTVSLCISKNNLERNKKIIEILSKSKLISVLKIAIQTIDQEIKDNIERIDINIRDQISMSKELKSKYPHLSIRAETILGLPGDTYEKTLDQINYLIDTDISLFTYSWFLLPEAPAFSPEMREKFKIGTIKKTLHSMSSIIYKDNSARDINVEAYAEIPNSNAEIVVETYSYTKDDWLDMFLLHSFASAGKQIGLNQYFIKYLKTHHQLEAKTVYDIIFKEFIKFENFKNTDLNKDVKNLKSQLHNWLFDSSYTNTAIDHHQDFPILFSTPQYLVFVFSINIKNFYQEVCNYFAKKLNDQKIIDLGYYISSGTIDITYNFKTGREFKTSYNWLDFFKNDSKLVKGNYQYKVSDTKLATANHECDWHLYDDELLRKKQFYYQTLSARFSSRFSTTIKLI